MNRRPKTNSMSAAALAIALANSVASGALAAQDTSLNVIGFSVDRTLFAFEEYGIADGSGAPSTTIYVIDTATDNWLANTPVSVGGGEEDGLTIENSPDPESATNALLQQYRASALAQIEPLFAARGGLREAITVAANPPTDFTNDAKTARFHPVPYFSAIRQSAQQKMLNLSITETTFPAGENCFGIFETMKGLTLTLTDERDGATKTLSADTRVPASRGCPQSYRIEKVVVPPRIGDFPDVLAVILRYATTGFEGADGKLMAVTYKMPGQY